MIEAMKQGGEIHAGDGGYSISTKEKYDEFMKVRNKSLAQSRIKELADRCFSTLPHENELEKFAGLIVRECGVALSPMLRDMVSRGHACDLIKQHFGVE